MLLAFGILETFTALQTQITTLSQQCEGGGGGSTSSISAYFCYSGCTTLVTIDVSVATSIGNGFCGGGTVARCEAATTMNIGGATEVGSSFCNGASNTCALLASIDLSKVTSVGTGFCKGCKTSSTTVVYLPKTVSNCATFLGVPNGWAMATNTTHTTCTHTNSVGWV